MAEVKTLVINNFQGRLTRYADGDINSGLAKYSTTFGNDPFSNPGNLTWFETPTRIDSAESVITDLIVAAKPRLESGITYVYAVGHTGRLYKIQVNDPTTYDPNYDTPVLLATLTVNTPTFKYGSSINFFGTTQKIFIGHDKGATSVAFNGTGEAEVGAVASWTANVPRPAVQFGASLYFGNGVNLTEVIAGGTVATYAKISPAFPIGTQVRDLDVSPEGNYLQIIVSRVSAPDLTSTTQDTSSFSSADSYRFLWDGITAGTSSYETYNSYSINSNLSFGPYTYTMGYDLGSTAIYSVGNKIITLPDSLSPNFNALFSTGNLMGFASPEQDGGFLKGTLMTFGQYDREIPEGLFRFFRVSAMSLGIINTVATSPGTMADDATVGTTAWSNPDNAKVSDDVYAVADLTITTNSPNTMADDATFGTVAWTDVDNAKVSDDVYATITQASGSNSSHYIKATNFGFSIPTGATITGIKVEAEVKVATNNKNQYVNTVNGYMQKAGVNAGDNVSFGGVWTTSDAYIGTVSETYLWGTTWTPAEINDAGFGYKFNCSIVGANTGYVDHIRITVYYTPISKYLKAIDFDFAIPINSVINGIKVEVEQKSTATSYENEIKIVKADGSIGTTNRSTGATIPSSDTYVEYGSSTDLWNLVWTIDDINNANFGVVFSALGTGVVSVDHIRITVYYTPTPETDIVQVPTCLIVSNLFYGSSSAGYTGNQVGSAKIYFSTLETSAAPTTKYKLYKFTTVPTGLGTAIAGVYETQNQLFSKKIKVSEVRVYGEPWVANNSFKIDLIGSNGVITNSSKTFTAGSTLTAGDDFARYSPAIQPTYTLGVRITNAGSVNHIINKIEIDFSQAGK